MKKQFTKQVVVTQISFKKIRFHLRVIRKWFYLLETLWLIEKKEHKK